MNQPGYVVDRRLDNVLQLRDFIISEVSEQIEKDNAFLVEAGTRMKQVEKTALNKAFSQMRHHATGQVLGTNVLLYQRIAQRWVGPVGWMIAVWARILIFGTGLMAIFRFGNPIRQVMGIFSSLRHFKDTKAAISETENNEQIGPAFQAYRVEILKNWPEIAELLVQGRFSKEIRNPKRMMLETSALDGAMLNLWRGALDNTIDRTSKHFSHLLLQIIFNLPTVALLGHVAWLTAKEYIAANYLTSEFFMHAFLAIVVVLLLSFFIFQIILRLGAGPERLMEKTFKNLHDELDPFQQTFLNPVFEQIDMLLQFRSPFVTQVPKDENKK